MRSKTLFVTFACFIACEINTVANENKDNAAEIVEAPIVYEDLTLILADKKGNVAAVVFPKEIANGIRYRFRFLRHGANKEIFGTGTVAQEWKEIKEGGESKFVLDANSTIMRAGSIELKWDYRIPGSGWVYYHPEQLSVQIGGSAERFKDVDLKRFAKKPTR